MLKAYPCCGSTHAAVGAMLVWSGLVAASRSRLGNHPRDDLYRKYYDCAEGLRAPAVIDQFARLIEHLKEVDDLALLPRFLSR
jgi:hypothetical protein